MKNLKLKNRNLPVITTTILCFILLGVCHFNVSAQENVKKWRWDEMRPEDMREAIKTNPVAWVLFSPLEWHGEAMAFNTDPLVGQHVIDKAWNIAGGVRIPTVLIGAETDYKYWGEKGLSSHWGLEQITEELNHGSLYVRPITLQLVVEDYLYCLQREGFKLAVVSTGHGATEHVKVLKEVCEKFNDPNGMRVEYLPYWAGGGQLSDELRFKGSGGHADFSEASMQGGVDPSMVDKSKFGVTEQDRKVKILHENVDKIDYDKARKIIEIRADGLAKIVKDIMAEINEAE